MPMQFGVHDTYKPAGMLDTLEGAYSAGAGTGISHRVPVVRKFENNWSDASTSFASGSRARNLFLAGHELVVSYKPPDSDATTKGYQKIINGSQDTVIDNLGDRIYALPFGQAVSGSQAGAAYGGNTATKIRISFHHEMDNDTVFGTATEFKQAYRRFMGRIKARRPNLAAERVICLPIFTGQANANGRAAQFYPGNTDTDYCDELGIDPYFYNVSKLVSFDDRLKPWQTWRDKYAAGRKLAVTETNRFDTVSAAVWYLGTIIDGMNANPDVNLVTWFSSPNGDAGSIAKSNHPEVWQAFKDVVDAAYAGTQPVDTTPPAPPLGLSATTVTSTSVTLSWQRPSAPDLGGYKITRDGAVAATLSNPATLSYVFSGQTAGSNHAYRIASYDKTTPPNISAYVGPAGTNVPLTVTHPQPAEPDPPVVDPSTAVTVNGHDVALAAVLSDPAGGTLTVAVDWGDGNTGTGSNATHSYTNPGTYQVQMVITSSVSSKSTTTSLSVVVEDEPDVDRTLGKVSLWLPQTGQPVGKFGPQFREDLNLITDSFEDLYADRYVQNGDDDPLPRLPIISVTGGTWTNEDPSDAYPKGRSLLTVTGGGGGGVPADGSITLSKLAFDVATQPEMDTALALKSDVGHTHTNLVAIGTVARSTHCLLRGLVGATFDPAAQANTTGHTVTAGTMVWGGFVAEISAAVTTIYFNVSSAGSGSGFTVKLHAADGTTVTTATGGVTAALTTAGTSSVTVPSTSLVRGNVYYVSCWTPSGAGAPSLRSSWLDVGINLGLGSTGVAGSASSGSAPTTLPLGSGTTARLILAGVK